MPRSGCPVRRGQQGGGEGRTLLAASRTAPRGRSGISEAALFTPCVFLLGRRQRGERVPSPVRSDASSGSRSHDALKGRRWGRGCWPRPAAAFSWETRVCDRRLSPALASRPPHVGLESWGEGSSGPQHRGAAESGRRQMERPLPGAGRGRSGLRGRGAGVVPVDGFGLRKGEMREGREGGQVAGGRLSPH